MVTMVQVFGLSDEFFKFRIFEFKKNKVYGYTLYVEKTFPRQITVMKMRKNDVIFGIKDLYDIWWCERKKFLKTFCEMANRKFFVAVEIFPL